MTDKVETRERSGTAYGVFDLDNIVRPDGIRTSFTRGNISSGVLDFLVERGLAGERLCLATITGLEGPSARACGSLIGVAEDGSYEGSFSGGCVESAVVAEAIAAIRSGVARKVRFGTGSPYVDIRLPCGGGVDILFQPALGHAMLQQIGRWIAQRTPFLIEQDLKGIDCRPTADPIATGWDDSHFRSWYAPVLRLVLLGNGNEVAATAALGCAFGAQIAVASPNDKLVSATAGLGVEAVALRLPGDPLPMIDRWTAILLLFHDHDWDAPLLARLIDSDAFFIGAMGSRRTHAARLEALRGIGMGDPALNRIRAPLGLIPSARDPATFALSALAEAVSEYRMIAGD